MSKRNKKFLLTFLIVVTFFISYLMIDSYNKDGPKPKPKTEIVNKESSTMEKNEATAAEKARKEKKKDELVPYSKSIKIYVTEETKKEITSKVYSLENEIQMISKVIYREARGLDKTHRAAVAWCILNRVDSSRYTNSISGAITSPNQYAWNPNTPVMEEHYELSKDVIIRWLLSREGIKDVGRVLPRNYFFFTGDGSFNYFRQDFNSTTYWDWSYPTPY